MKNYRQINFARLLFKSDTFMVVCDLTRTNYVILKMLNLLGKCSYLHKWALGLTCLLANHSRLTESFQNYAKNNLLKYSRCHKEDVF